MSVPTEVLRPSNELGVVHGSTLHDKPPLSTAVHFVDDFLRRDRQYPELKNQLSATRHEYNAPADQSSKFAPFSLSSVVLPKELEALPKDAAGILPNIDTVWIASGRTAYLWNYKTLEPYRVFEDADHDITAIFATKPKPDVFVDTVKYLIVVTTTHTLKIYAVGADATFFDSGLAISHNFNGAIPKFADIKDRIIFAAGPSLYEVEYRAKESWFRSKMQLHQASAGSSWFGQGENGVKQVSVDPSRSLLYTLSAKGLVSVYDYSNGIKFERSLPQQKTIVGIAAISKHQSYTEILVMITAEGERIYLQDSRGFRVSSTKPAPTDTKLELTSCSVFDRDLFISTHKDGLFLSAVDSPRLMHLVDQHAALGFPEITATHTIKDVHTMAQISTPQNSDTNEAALQYNTPPQTVAVLTKNSVHFIRRSLFYEIFHTEGQLPAHITNVYGHIEICCAAICVATRPNIDISKTLRDNARNNYYKFGGIPVFQKDIEANRYTYLLDAKSSVGAKEITEVGIRLSSSFDGLAAYTSRLLQKIWEKTLFSYKRRRDGSVTDLVLNVNRPDFETLHSHLSGLSSFLESSKPADTKQQYSHAIGDSSILSQAEQKSIAAMAQLIKSAQQGIAFLLLLESETSKSSNGLEELLAYVSKDMYTSLLEMTFKSFFSEAKYSEVTRELVTCLINYIINRGDSIDSVARMIQDRCESYCSSSDVLVYKALQYIHSAKASPENDLRVQKLYKSSALFVKAAANISYDTLKDIVSEYVSMDFYPGVVSVTLAAALEIDRANVALGYLRDGRPENDARQKIYAQKTRYFDLIFNVLDKATLKADSEVYKLLTESKDEVFAYYFYDWLLDDRVDLLAQINTLYIQGWLQTGAKRDARIAELLWKYYLKQDDLLAAADVLLNIAKGSLPVPMMQRVELLSRAMGYCKSQFPQAQQQQVFELGTMIGSYLKIANVQAELLNRVETDNAISPAQQSAAIKDLNSHLLTVTELFNEYAEPLHYYDICLYIFEVADFTDPTEVMQCYERLLDSVRVQDAAEGTQHYSHVSSVVSSLGRRFAGVNSLFPVGQLYPYLQRYAAQHCPDAPRGWVLETFTKSGVPAAALV